MSVLHLRVDSSSLVSTITYCITTAIILVFRAFTHFKDSVYLRSLFGDTAFTKYKLLLLFNSDGFALVLISTSTISKVRKKIKIFNGQQNV
ncbi:hypothetical protein TCAL_06212 [Tigriopus californicus]|uniref:Uncharacterized protein n=1 Tax=Tigriopus californicus TaxID=6832 RepID=A0A553NVM3_TIGCA|nr:hypothetical protein TCAL_06212 [Tigriopus californicus]